MPKIEIINQLPGGMRFTSPDRAKHFCKLGLAAMAGDGRLFFYPDLQARKLGHQLTEEDEFAINRGGVLFWNGARANYIDDRDLAMFPPGCNVLFPKPHSPRAMRRYAE